MTLEFANWWAFLLLLVLPPLLVWLVLQPRAALRHPDTGLLAGLPAGRAPLVAWGRALLRVVALALVIVALSGPRWPDMRTRLQTEGVSIVLLVDVSASMNEQDFDWNGEPVSRLEAVKRSFQLFVKGGAAEGVTAPDGAALGRFEGRPTDLIGMVSFASRPETVCPLTLSHTALVRALEREKARDSADERETNLVDATATGLKLLQDSPSKRKVLVLLTDGEHNVPPRSGWTTRQAAQVAASLRVPVYTIDAGGNEASPDFKSDVRAQAVQTLKEMSDISKGQYFPARDTAALLQACGQIDRLEREAVESYQLRRYHEAYPWVALAGFVVFVVALVLDQTLWRTLP